MFRVGLQGRTVLFFYNPFTEHPIGNVGRSLHKKTALSFLENARKIWKAGGEKPSQLAYLMGFLCHFMLDSACHPYINGQIEKIGVGHIAIETEFERLLLLLDGKDPVSFQLDTACRQITIWRRGSHLFILEFRCGIWAGASVRCAVIKIGW